MLGKILFLLLVPLAGASTHTKSFTVSVKGMVCAFCAQGIEKKFKEMPEVKSVQVSLKTKKVDVVTKGDAQISDEKIKEIVSESGYDVERIERVK